MSLTTDVPVPSAMAACRVGDEAKARKWITSVPVNRRGTPTAICKQLGIDLKKPVTTTEDCEADPMACQH